MIIIRRHLTCLSRLDLQLQAGGGGQLRHSVCFNLFRRPGPDLSVARPFLKAAAGPSEQRLHANSSCWICRHGRNSYLIMFRRLVLIGQATGLGRHVSSCFVVGE